MIDDYVEHLLYPVYFHSFHVLLLWCVWCVISWQGRETYKLIDGWRICLSPTSNGGAARMSMSGASVGGVAKTVGGESVGGGSGSGTSPRKSAPTGPDTVRRSKSQGSRRGEKTLSKCYSMAGQGSPEANLSHNNA
jgi:hypothetical protein